ncbi:MAG: hypothetical protein HYV03_08710, partial [Deltaproteobacteria bacterium]|nr:hypothetical protein [Deltaproteobacteria bacterium]
PAGSYESSEALALSLHIFDAKTSKSVACIGEVALKPFTQPGTLHTQIDAPLRFVEGVTELPSLVRVGLFALMTLETGGGCPMNNPLHIHDLIAISPIFPVDQLLEKEIVMNDGATKTRFAKAVWPEHPLLSKQIDLLLVDKIRFGSEEINEADASSDSADSWITGPILAGPEIEVYLFEAGTDRPIACSGGYLTPLGPVNDPNVLYESLNAGFSLLWTESVPPTDQVYFGLVERDQWECPKPPVWGSDTLFAKSVSAPLADLLKQPITFDGVPNATLTVISMPADDQ